MSKLHEMADAMAKVYTVATTGLAHGLDHLDEIGVAIAISMAKAGLEALKHLPDDILAEETADLDVDWDASIDAIIAEKDGETTP